MDETGLGVTIGSQATAAAIAALGGIKRIAVLTPYWPVMNAEVDALLQRRRPHRRARHRAAMHVVDRHRRGDVGPVPRRDPPLDGDDVDAIVQVGTNLSMVRLAAAAELWLGKPVIAINTATYWHALRANGIHDRIAGFGRLLEAH